MHAPKRPQTPSHLLDDGGRFYAEMVDEYGIVDCAGLALVTRAAECLDRLAAARRSIADDGEITRNQYNMPVLNPACKLEKESRDGFLAAVRMLNLDLEPPNRVGRPAARLVSIRE